MSEVMRNILNELAEEIFELKCGRCNRAAFDLQSTEKGDFVVYCRSCGNARMVIKKND